MPKADYFDTMQPVMQTIVFLYAPKMTIVFFNRKEKVILNIAFSLLIWYNEYVTKNVPCRVRSLEAKNTEVSTEKGLKKRH